MRGAGRQGGRLAGALVATLLTALAPHRLTAQTPPDSATGIRWYHPVLAAGAVALLTIADDDVRRYVQRHRSATGDDLSRDVRWIGNPVGSLGVATAVTLAGVVSGSRGVTKTGIRSGAALALGEAVTLALKPTIGRARPYQDSSSAYDFRPFGGQIAFPSGHATAAFALATVYADAIDHPVATVGLYSVATLVAWSRMNDDQHWLSDVVAGALIGTAAGKIVDGRWRIFGLRPPEILLTGRGLGVGWSLRLGGTARRPGTGSGGPVYGRATTRTGTALDEDAPLPSYPMAVRPQQ